MDHFDQHLTIRFVGVYFRPTDDVWPLHLLDLSDDNHLDVTYKLLKHSPLATKFYLDTFVFPLVLGMCRYIVVIAKCTALSNTACQHFPAP